MEGTKELITTDAIRSKVYILRGQQVMLDQDLAEIYGYQVKNLNQQVKRNLTRFPEDFMFQLTKEEVELVKSQFVTSRNINYFEGQEGGRRKLPYAFTEQGIYMLAAVLRGELAEQQSIFIMRTFREMRHYISQNQQFVTRNEMDLLTAKVGTITERQDRMEKKVDSIQKDVTILADNFITDKDIYKGQKLEADIAYIEIYQQAKKSIYVVDDYMNAKSLQHLSQKADGVEVVLFTENGKGGRGFLTILGGILMDKASGKLTVYFEEPFWVGVFERIEDGKLSVAKVTFGAEPKDYEVQEYIQKYYFSLKFSPTVETVVKDIKRNPKRMQREAKNQTMETGIGTKSQQALKLQQEQNNQERKERSRKKKEAKEQRMFELKQQKKREKHKGH
jgi:hypothetical protein